MGHAVSATKHFVYVLRSNVDRNRYYVGLTSDVDRRLAVHNSGRSIHTARDRPWELVTSVKFVSAASAIEFEKYLGLGASTCQTPFRVARASSARAMAQRLRGLDDAVTCVVAEPETMQCFNVVRGAQYPQTET